MQLDAGAGEACGWLQRSPAHAGQQRHRGGHGERSRSQLHFQLGGPENVQILAVNLLAVNVLAVNRPLPLHTVAKSAICTLNSAKKRVTHPI